MSFRHEARPFIAVSLIISAVILSLFLHFGVPKSYSILSASSVGSIMIGYLLYFFRDPHRAPPTDESRVLAAADGVIAKITTLNEEDFKKISAFCGLEQSELTEFLKPDVLRISTFLSLFDVHVNRAPISGESRFLGYFPGKHLFTFDEKSSDVNQHNSILITGNKTRCLLNQIVGPVCRRVVYWHDEDSTVKLKMGEKIGMMKFGSRLDIYFPKSDIELYIKEGDKVSAGLTTIARFSE